MGGGKVEVTGNCTDIGSAISLCGGESQNLDDIRVLYASAMSLIWVSIWVGL